MKANRILIADDDKGTSGYLSLLLTDRGYFVDTVGNGRDAVERFNSSCPPDLLLLDVLMPELDGIETLHQVRKINASIPIIILSAIGHAKTVVDAMKMGAVDYLTKPVTDEELESAIEAVFGRTESAESRRPHFVLEQARTESREVVSASPQMDKVKAVARQVGATDVPVLILGESGVGKEVIARYIHANSTRAAGPFVKINCAALPNDLLESELFGYERGAFTGAMFEMPGKFELASKGFIFLDEIGDMSLHLQAKMLHVLQDGEYMRLGGKRPMRSDARVLTATNKNIERMVSNGTFREDLYFRLNVISLDIPPLRERPEDIPLLISYFIEKYRGEYASSVERLPAQIFDEFMRYRWPGNARQLENAVKRYLILQDAQVVLPASTTSEPAAPVDRPFSLKDVSAHAAERAERETVLRALEETKWNRKKAAKNLGICYKALLNKLKKWRLTDGGLRPESAAGDSEHGRKAGRIEAA
jgi:two-component system response regulator AtoC